MDLTVALSAEHYEELVVSSVIDPEVAAARGYRTLTGTGEDRDLLESLGFKPYVWNRDDAYPGLLIPMHDATGAARGHQYKPAKPRMRPRADKPPAPVKYESPKGAELMVDVPALTRERLANPGTSLWITEGMKKTDALVSHGQAAIGLTGVFNWRNGHGTLGDWEDIPIKNRPVVVCFDADAAGNRNVQLAMGRLGAWLRTRGASAVHYLVVPAQVEGTEVKGVDDYFAAGGTLEGLAAAATPVPPGQGEKGAEFTDAFLVEELAESMAGRFCWAAGLGWLRWNGCVWKEVSDVEPLEAVRVWASEQFDKVCDEQKREPARNLGGKIAGWRAILGKGRLVALKDLAKGLLQRDAAEFDGDPDLMTVKNGTLHLPTGKLLPFDPEHCITKSADADYRPGYRHPSWTAALKAIPAELHAWYQDRLGQALTGYPTPDHTLVIGCGTGANGKSTVADLVRRALGGYGILVSDRVLMANPDAHPTELMDLRGIRFAVLEETPEARHLNVQRLKATIGTPVIRARHIRQDTIEFLTSHSLFINTNYKPVVTETDWGTWRRLALMTFPFTFKKPGVPLDGPWERAGDPRLAYAANDPEIRTAALVWMAEGARAWYARERMMLPHPETVERHTREWRAETDLILGFSDEMLRFDADAFTQTRDMLAAFNEWAGERGHRPWNDRTFATRFGDHDTVRAAKVKQGRFTVGGKQQRGWAGVEIDKGGRDPFTGEREEPPAPEPKQPYGAEFWVGADPSAPDPGAPGMVVTRLNDCGVVVRADPQEPNRTTEPVVLGFDLETASAGQLFTGGHEGPFVRLGGTTAASTPTTNASLLIDGLSCADTIYGHNILGFDLLALTHHHGADYDALAAKAVDTMALERLIDPPLSKGMPNGYYGLDAVAHRLGHEGKTDDLKGLAKRYGGFDRIPVDSREYQDYLRGDLAATKAVWEAQQVQVKTLGLEPYARREMKIVALQNRMTLNGWKTDEELLARRVAREEEKRQEAIKILHESYGVPLAEPDRFRLLPKAQWPEEFKNRTLYRAWRWADITYTEPCDPVSAECESQDCAHEERVISRQLMQTSVARNRAGVARRYMNLFPEAAVDRGLAVRIPGKTHKSPWVTTEGKAALVKAFHGAGAEHVPVSAKTGDILTSSDAMGESEWWDKNRGRMVKGMLHPDCYGGNDAVRAICDVLAHATGTRSKYAEIARHVTAQGRVHPGVGAAQGSGRWGTTEPSTTNMGKRGDAAEERDVLVADDGQVLITCDLSQVDMRAVAALSQDREYMKLFEPGRDAHTEMAEVYFGDRTPESRQKTKAINHKFNYGGGVSSTAAMNQLDEDVVQQAYDARAQAYPRVMEWLGEVRETAASGQLLDNGFGRPMRPDPERAHTQGPALMGQGAARDIMCESLLRLVDCAADKGYNVRPHLRGVVHDEVILSVPEAEAELWRQILAEAFTWEWRGVPILCEVSEPAYRWSECK